MSETMRILIIDDDPGIRDTYQAILTPPADSELMARGAELFGGGSGHLPQHTSRSFGPFDLCLAKDGEEGVRHVNDTLAKGTPPFCVAFVDMKMPGLNGAETVQRLWTLDEDIRVVIVTAFSEFTPEEIVRQTGRQDVFYLRKPFNHEEIRQFARVLSNEWMFDRERKRLALHLENMNRDLKEKVEEQAAIIVQTEKMASIGILAAGVAHEINNPIAYVNGNLSTMKTYVQTLSELINGYDQLDSALRREDTDRAREILDRIGAFKLSNQVDFIQKDMVDLVNESLDGTDRIKNIVRDLRTFSRVDEAEFRDIDINESITATLNIMASELKDRAVVEKDFGDLPHVYCYARKIGQVFLNLLLNAAQSMEDKGVIRITTRAVSRGRRDEDQFVDIAISDTGSGINPKHIAHLYDPFFTTKPTGQGTGLGLSIVYDIITFHKGEIRVQSTPGEGSTFTVTIPVKSVRER